MSARCKVCHKDRPLKNGYCKKHRGDEEASSLIAHVKIDPTVQMSGNDRLEVDFGTGKYKYTKAERKPCNCLKGGFTIDGKVCPKCGGTEWVYKI